MRASSRRRIAAVVGTTCTVALIAGLLVSPAAADPEACTYDSASKTVTATVTSGGEARLVVAGGAIHFGQVATACGDATTTNTDTINVNATAGTNERLFIDTRGGAFEPGFTSELSPTHAFISEIEIYAALGDNTDTLVFAGTDGNEGFAAGQRGIPLNSDDDPEIVLTPGAMRLEVNLFGGDDAFHGRGAGPSAGLEYLGPIIVSGGEGNDNLRGGAGPDVFSGGAGNDALDGNTGDDNLDGGSGNDTITGRTGNDTIIGGSGIDSMTGSSEDDTFFAIDAEADSVISGGQGVDTAHYDLGLDPNPIAVENKFGQEPPPPPSEGPCSFNPATKVAFATIDPGTTATLEVVSGAIHFGGEPCAAATTTNTDTIKIAGQAGTKETLVLDMRGGAFAPGAAAEANSLAEIEVQTTLGDAADVVIVHGTVDADTIRVGQTGVGLNADSDNDVTFAPLPAEVAVFGHGGVNLLSGRGGAGTGSTFLGKVTLHAGPSGDLLQGGSGHDELYGGSGNDTLEGNAGNDTLDGAGGNDILKGADGNDALTGGSGSDDFIGSGGDDTFHAADDEADVSLQGGPGVDTAYYDAGLDPNPIAVENRISA